ncbi:MAG: hypothetical protein ACXWD3_13745, partial [Mycobacterium sp.]
MQGRIALPENPLVQRSRVPAETRQIRRWLAALVGAALGLSLLPDTAAVAAPKECAPLTSGGPIFVSPDCADPAYNTPVVDNETDVTSPVAHRKVSGHFEGTAFRFNIYLPAKIRFENRFFQLVYPTIDENIGDRNIEFAAASGAYTLQTNGGSGYRVDAAAALFSRAVAAKYYGSTKRIYGYIYGPSGGSYQTIGAIENSRGIWDGAVPIVNAVPTSLGTNFFVRAFARFVLKDSASKIADAVSPGGSGNPYTGLTATQRKVLHEVTTLGVPLRAWEDVNYVLGLDAPDGLLGLGNIFLSIDSTYVNDFWTKPGYLGTENSELGDMFRAARTPENEGQLALMTYHRHALPTGKDFTAFDQYRDSTGKPIYPQRPFSIPALLSSSVSGGGTQTGAINGKVIVVDSLLDAEAFPWDGDWYAQRVKKALGDAYDDNFRLWYNDNTDHIETARTQRLVSWTGLYEQALRDVSAWAERGVAPARSTAYTLVDSQVTVPSRSAAKRGGIQPFVDLAVTGPGHGLARTGNSVKFRAVVHVPPGQGKVISAEWDFEGSGDFTK